ncbi:MAG: ribonuclease J [Acidobacteria bacterium]|nr:ribonuclease J [Acidobacteriota bacterium]
MKEEKMEIVPLGGLGEFGMNMMAVRYGEDILVVDAGLMFPREDLLGVDRVIPDFAYLFEHRDRVRGIVLTHGHEDHIGALPYLLEDFSIPVYGTRLTLGLLRGRLRESGLLEHCDLRPVRARDLLDFGRIRVEILGMTHSLADSIGLAITTPVGTVIHTGDFKLDSAPLNHSVTDYARIAQLGEEGVLALLSDSTNSERRGFTPPEINVRSGLELIFHLCPRKIVVACFASSIHRIQIVLDLARAFGRRVAVLGRSMKDNIRIASELGYLAVPPDLLLEPGAAKTIPDEELLVLCTGSQGEPLAALTRLAFDKQKDISVTPGDAVILSARVIPGHEGRISRLVNHFCRRGARVFDEGHWMTHVSGHASAEELKIMLNLARPRFFVPVHGEYRQLFAHTLLARETGIDPENILLAESGDIIELTPSSIRVAGKAPVGRRLIDSGGVAELDEVVIGDRQHLSEEGVVLAVVAVNKATGAVERVSELVSRGHIQEAEGAAFLAEARQAALLALEECSEEERRDSGVLTEVVRVALKRYFRKRTGTRPMIVPVIIEV